MNEYAYEEDDEIMAELRMIRDEIMREHGYDYDRYWAHLREMAKRERARGVPYIDVPLRRRRGHEHDAA